MAEAKFPVFFTTASAFARRGFEMKAEALKCEMLETARLLFSEEERFKQGQTELLRHLRSVVKLDVLQRTEQHGRALGLDRVRSSGMGSTRMDAEDEREVQNDPR